MSLGQLKWRQQKDRQWRGLPCSQGTAELRGKSVQCRAVPSGATWAQYFTLGQFTKSSCTASPGLPMRSRKENNTQRITCRKLQCRAECPGPSSLTQVLFYFIRMHRANCPLCRVSGELLTPRNHFHGNFKTMSAITEY